MSGSDSDMFSESQSNYIIAPTVGGGGRGRLTSNTGEHWRAFNPVGKPIAYYAFHIICYGNELMLSSGRSDLCNTIITLPRNRT